MSGKKFHNLLKGCNEYLLTVSSIQNIFGMPKKVNICTNSFLKTVLKYPDKKDLLINFSIFFSTISKG